MSLKVPYKKYPIEEGGFFYTATLPVNIGLPAKNAPRSKRIEAIIDSGASVCQFHAAVGRSLGIEIEKGDKLEILAADGRAAIYVHEIALHIPGGPVLIKAGFSDNLPVIGLLGMSGFFEHFMVKFDCTALRCELDRIFKS